MTICLSERYSDNGGLSLKSGQVTLVTRSSSGSSHGSGSGSSGYQSERREERQVIRDKCHVELDSDDEVTEPVSQVVTVTGGLQLGGAITSKVCL